MSTVTLMQGDCCEKLNGIPAHSVNLVLADPPYGITHQAWDTVLPFEDFLEKNGKRLSQPEFLLSCCKAGISYADAMSIWTENKQQGIWTQLDRILTENGAVILFSAGAYTKTLMDGKTIPWRYNLIWQKTSPVGFLNANRMPLRAHEDILVFYKKLPTYNPQKTSGHPRKVSTAEHMYLIREHIAFIVASLYSIQLHGIMQVSKQAKHSVSSKIFQRRFHEAISLVHPQNALPSCCRNHFCSVRGMQ